MSFLWVHYFYVYWLLNYNVLLKKMNDIVLQIIANKNYYMMLVVWLFTICFKGYFGFFFTWLACSFVLYFFSWCSRRQVFFLKLRYKQTRRYCHVGVLLLAPRTSWSPRIHKFLQFSLWNAVHNNLKNLWPLFYKKITKIILKQLPNINKNYSEKKIVRNMKEL